MSEQQHAEAIAYLKYAMARIGHDGFGHTAAEQIEHHRGEIRRLEERALLEEADRQKLRAAIFALGGDPDAND